MKKKNKYKLIILILFFTTFFNSSELIANDDKKFLSLKNNEVNLRLGPSFEYPIKLTYKKKFLPLIILDSSGNWRKIKDHENNSGWIHISQLSKKKTAINTEKNLLLYAKATIYSKPLARIDFGRLLLINKCNLKWCKITSGNFSGWVYKRPLWGDVK